MFCLKFIYYHNDQAQTRALEQLNRSCPLTLLKSGVCPIQVSRELSIPTRTLRDWRKASMASGNWNGGAGDNNNIVARPAPHKKEPGTRIGGCQVAAVVNAEGGPTNY